jgi:hypothetical protein
MRSGVRARWAVAGALAFLGAAAVGLTHGSVRVPSSTGTIPEPSGNFPFIGAVKEPSITVAESAVGRHILRPDMCGANDAILNQIDVNPSTGQIYLSYQDLPSDQCSGLTGGSVSVMEFLADDAVDSTDSGPTPGASTAGATPAPSPPDTATLQAEMESRARAMGPVADVATVDNVPAIILQGNYAGDCQASPAPGQEGCAPAQQNAAAVEMQIGSVVVQVMGPGSWTQDEIVAVANTVA